MLTLIFCWLVVVAFVIVHGVHAQRPSPEGRRARAVLAWSLGGALAGAAIGFALWHSPSGAALAGAVIAGIVEAVRLRA